MSFSLKRDEDPRCALAPIPLPSCANRRFCTPHEPKPSPGVRIGAFAHGKARNPCPVCKSTLLHTATAPFHYHLPTRVSLNYFMSAK